MGITNYIKTLLIRNKVVSNIIVLATPFFIIFLAWLNGEFGIMEWKHARIKSFPELSYFIFFSTFFLLLILILFNVCWYSKYKSSFKNKKSCLIFVIFNCLFCLALALYRIIYVAIDPVPAAISLIPFLLIIPVQFYLWFYVLFAEFLKKDKKNAILVSTLIFWGIYLLLLCLSN